MAIDRLHAASRSGQQIAPVLCLHPRTMAVSFGAKAALAKGGIENAIGRLRRPLPRKFDLAAITQEHLHEHARRYNDTPRKCRDFLHTSRGVKKPLSSCCNSNVNSPSRFRRNDGKEEEDASYGAAAAALHSTMNCCIA